MVIRYRVKGMFGGESFVCEAKRRASGGWIARIRGNHGTLAMHGNCATFADAMWWMDARTGLTV